MITVLSPSVSNNVGSFHLGELILIYNYSCININVWQGNLDIYLLTEHCQHEYVIFIFLPELSDNRQVCTVVEALQEVMNEVAQEMHNMRGGSGQRHSIVRQSSSADLPSQDDDTQGPLSSQVCVSTVFHLSQCYCLRDSQRNAACLFCSTCYWQCPDSMMNE